MDLEHRVKLTLEHNAPLDAYHACILLNDATLCNPAEFSAQNVARERSRIHDAFVKHWFQGIVGNIFGKDVSFDKEEPPFQFTLLATGGYGRDELNPMSDIDLKLVIDEPALQGNPLIKLAAQEATYTFEKKYGFPLELSCHTLADLNELTGAGLNTFLDMRHLHGEQKLTERIRAVLNMTYDPADLFLHNLQAYTVLAKNHKSLDDFSEFNIKNGSGGLRVFHIARYLDSLPTQLYNTEELINHGPFSLAAQEERTKIPESIDRAFTVLLKTRSWLNIKRKSEGQKDIIYVEDFNSLSPGMRQALATARHTVATYFEQTKRKKLQLGLQVPRGEYSFVMTAEGLKQAEDEKIDNKKQIERGYRLLHLAHERQIPLHPKAIEQLSRLVPSSLFIEGLKIEQPYTELAKTLHKTGSLSRIIPGFETLYGLISEDRDKRQITTAGKTLERLENLEKIIENERLTSDERATLRFTTLIADIPIDANTSNPLLEYPGLKEERARNVLFLLSKRKTLVNKALNRLNDDATVKELAEICGDVKKVELLHLFTKVNIKGTRDLPSYVLGNIEELVIKTKNRIEGKDTVHIPRGILSEKGEAIYDDLGPDFHSSRYAGAQLPTWVSLLERVENKGEPIVKRFSMGWPLFGIVAKNKNGLLATITSTFYNQKINLRQVHAYTLSKTGFVLDFFETESMDENKGEEIAKALTRNILYPDQLKINPREILEPLQGEARITLNKPSGYYVLEYRSKRDSPGILYALTSTLSENLQASICGMNAHVQANGSVEDRVFFTLPEQKEEKYVIEIFKDATGIK
ncbi:MAG: hypothetical protein Q7R87_02215 [Nanoarchaeota archaeon]|nr:hypothetical protein [Nanoarchaeota archaeon]